MGLIHDDAAIHNEPDASRCGALGERTVRLHGQRVDRCVKAGGLAAGRGERDRFRPVANRTALGEQRLPGERIVAPEGAEESREIGGHDGVALVELDHLMVHTGSFPVTGRQNP
jgi:hypothetical protein